MPVKQTNKYLKLTIVYVFYNYFLKVFFYFLNPFIYNDNPDNVSKNLFFEGRPAEGVEMVSKVASNIYINIIHDLFGLLPYTLMNLYIFFKLIKHLMKSEERIYQILSFVILKLYLFWCLIYLCYISYIFLKTGVFKDTNSPHSPHGSLTITYMLLGNFVFLLIFVPLWNKFIKKWVM